MRRNIINFLRAAFPFLATLFLWRLASPILNPGGVLALIPIFFCTFVRPVAFFAPFGIVMCFLLDVKFDTVLYWTALMCACYAVNGFQNFIDLTRADRNGIGVFLLFFGVGVTVCAIAHFTFYNIARATLMTLWAGALYMPICELITRVTGARHD